MLATLFHPFKRIFGRVFHKQDAPEADALDAYTDWLDRNTRECRAIDKAIAEIKHNPTPTTVRAALAAIDSLTAPPPNAAEHWLPYDDKQDWIEEIEEILAIKVDGAYPPTIGAARSIAEWITKREALPHAQHSDNRPCPKKQ